MRRWWWVPVLVVATSACGGGAAEFDDDAAAGVASDLVVDSADGLATLTLAEGSLPEGTSLSDIRLDAVASLDAPVGTPIVRVQLLPHGLTLNEPAVLAITLPDFPSGGYIAVHHSEAYAELLEGQLHVDPERLTFTTPIEHFSIVDLFGVILDGSMTLAPNPVSPGQKQNADGTLELVNTVSLLLASSTDEESVTLYEFAVGTLEPEDSTVDWRDVVRVGEDASFDGEFWDPPFDTATTVATPTGGTFTASSTCVQPNTTMVKSETRGRVDLTLLSVGAETDVEHLKFAEVFVGLDPSDARSLEDFPGGGEYIYLDERDIGETLSGWFYAHTESESICTDVSTATSSTISTLPPIDDDNGVVSVPPGMDPRAVIGSVEPVVTANGTRGFVVIFVQGWDEIPDLYSFFFMLDFSDGLCSETGGVENHANVKTQLGSADTSLLDTGRVLIDTGCALDTAGFDIVGRSGSQDTSSQQAQFLDFVAHISGTDLDGARGVEGEVVCDFADPVALASGCSQ